MHPVALDTLEQEASRARKRLAADIKALRNPDVRRAAQDYVVAQAVSFKDEIVQKVTAAASETANSLWADMKVRASANPGAALAIGAGVAWHVARHPPITTLLIGVGLTSLMRSQQTAPSPMVTATKNWIGSANQLAEDVSERAEDFAHDAQEAFSAAVATTSEMAGHSADVVQEVFSDVERRDTFLVGVAALAVGAAALLAFNRAAGSQ
jgi:hypothetical protein